MRYAHGLSAYGLSRGRTIRDRRDSCTDYPWSDYVAVHYGNGKLCLRCTSTLWLHGPGVLAQLRSGAWLAL
jgi:hypothetical protein